MMEKKNEINQKNQVNMLFIKQLNLDLYETLKQR